MNIKYCSSSSDNGPMAFQVSISSDAWKLFFVYVQSGLKYQRSFERKKIIWVRINITLAS
jgi:hypothetical protein